MKGLAEATKEFQQAFESAYWPAVRLARIRLGCDPITACRPGKPYNVKLDWKSRNDGCDLLLAMAKGYVEEG